MKNLINLYVPFMRAARLGEFAQSDVLVYQHLLSIDNDLKFKEWFGVSTRRLMQYTGVKSSHTVLEARNRLKQLGWIDFRVEKRGSNQATLYRLIERDTATDTATGTATGTATLNIQDKTRPDLPEEPARVCEDVPVIPPRVKQAFEQTFRPILPQDLDRLSAMVRDYGELSMVSAIRAAKERGGQPPVREPLSWLGKVLRTRLSQTQTQAEREEEYQPPECRAPNPFIGMSREEYLDKCRKLYGKEAFERMMRDGQI